MYQQCISRRNPGLIVVLVDRSDSMRRPWAGTGQTLAEGAARTVNDLLLELCLQSTKEPGAPMRSYFYVGIYGYGLRPSTGEEGVESALPSALAGRGIVPLSELADHPLAIRAKPSSDAPGLTVRMPVWIEPEAGFRTPMCKAIATAGQHVHEWATAFPDSFPPIVINITDGFVTDSPYEGADLAAWAARLATISTHDGQALFFNVFLSADRAPMTSFPSSAATLPAPGPELFAISSTLPEPMLHNARAAGLDIEPGARGFVFNADLAMLTTFSDLATRLEVRNG
jgi:hypothetical protein